MNTIKILISAIKYNIISSIIYDFLKNYGLKTILWCFVFIGEISEQVIGML